jgi:rhodanese-related sulfurtransferase
MSSKESPQVVAAISPRQLYDLYEAGKPVELIDVRTPAEYRSVHATIARVVPLDELNPQVVMETRRRARHEPLYVICRSGARSAKACERFRSAGYDNVVDVSGGTLAWEQAGLPVVRGKQVLPLDRQIQLAAGMIVLTGFVLGEVVNPIWFWLSGFVGCGLVFAGATGFCPMASLMARMPWNQSRSEPPCRSR